MTLHAQGGVVKGRCPYCGAKVRVKVRPGQVREVIWLHEPCAGRLLAGGA
ncbi:MAG: hypothetical protein ACPL5F_12145 [Moorellaceae bacterium]